MPGAGSTPMAWPALLSLKILLPLPHSIEVVGQRIDGVVVIAVQSALVDRHVGYFGDIHCRGVIHGQDTLGLVEDALAGARVKRHLRLCQELIHRGVVVETAVGAAT